MVLRVVGRVLVKPQITEISAFAAPTKPATATALAKTMQQISNALSFIFAPHQTAAPGIKQLGDGANRVFVYGAETRCADGTYSLSLISRTMFREDTTQIET